jgi:hypothetical protein
MEQSTHFSQCERVIIDFERYPLTLNVSKLRITYIGRKDNVNMSENMTKNRTKNMTKVPSLEIIFWDYH